ncbi:hypothetical protein [Lysobacter gummosus]|uniref:hypothetical protein n=1 Tax=Lysobacter gummosus TaxID=262324 RepID=UPI003633F139
MPHLNYRGVAPRTNNDRDRRPEAAHGARHDTPYDHVQTHSAFPRHQPGRAGAARHRDVGAAERLRHPSGQ